MKVGDTQGEGETLLEWRPENNVRKVAVSEARLSRGFLQSEPQKWFPGLALHWQPLIHSLGLEVKIQAVAPCLVAPRGLEAAYSGAVDDEPITMLMNKDSAHALASAVVPGALDIAQPVVVEYLARRLLTSLASSWSGKESASVVFDGEINPWNIREAGAIRLDLSVNGNVCQVWVLLGKILVDKLDGLWKRQVRSMARQAEQPLDLSLEVTQLAVPPSLLVEYMKPQAVIDLEVAASDHIMLRSGSKAWSLGRLCDIEGKFGFEILDDPLPSPKMPEGATRLAIEFGRVRLDPALVAEVSQKGAILETNILCSPQVNLVINNEKVAAAELLLYEGRFAMRVC